MISLPLEPMAWYRYDKLVERNLIPRYEDFTAKTLVRSLLTEHNQGTVVYVPSLLFDGKHEDNDSYDYLKSSLLLKNFLNLLEITKSCCSLKFIFLTLHEHKISSIQRALLKTFELSLSSYENTDHLDIIKVKLDSVYGQWQGRGDNYANHISTDRIYIEDVVEKVVLSMNCNDSSCTSVLRSDMYFEMLAENPNGIAKTKKWVNEYSAFLHVKKKNVIISTYFTNSKHAPNKHYYIVPNLSQFFEAWFLTGKQFDVHFVIIHDSLSEQFQNNLKEFYPEHIEFVKLDSLNGRSTNDARFYAEQNYLINHPEINKVLLTDCRDVIFMKDPFKIMDIIGDYLYIGIDNSFFRSIYGSWINRWSLSPCSFSSELHGDAAKRYPVHNAGVIGGTRHVMLSYLTQLIRYFDKALHTRNCNMGVVSLVTEKHFSNDYFAGYPFQAVMELPLAIPQGLAIRHKRTGEV